jgi:gamma-glutamylcyclotransferase (GGCT)/AIG2-like uncharacterized protein YtfP
VTNYIFVYGSLKSGRSNNHLLIASEFVSVGYIPGCALVDLGRYPGLVPCQCDSRDWAEGEIWKSSDLQETLSYLDHLESEGTLYKRVAMPVVGARPSDEVLCWTYLYMPKYKARALIDGGRWSE